MIFNDEPIHPLDKSVYYVEYMMRHKGAPFMKSPALSLNWFQLESVDVYIFLTLVSIIIVYILVYILKYFVSFVFY